MKTFGVLALSVGLGGAAASTWAQGSAPADTQSQTADDQYVAEIVVTARRREERLSDIPSAVSVITAEALSERGGASSTLDLLADQPSVRFNNLSSTITSEISIRGSSTARATNGDPSVGLYRSGAYIAGGAIGGRNFTRIDFLDLERVEVLRGTQGALYGRNAVGGAVNMIAAKPQFENSGYVKTQYVFDTEGFEGQAAINVAPSNTIAVRISADGIDQDEGFFYNPVHDRYFDRQKGYGVRGQVRLRTEAVDFTLLAETQDLTTPGIPYRIYIPAGTPGFPGGYIQPKFSYPWNTPPDAQQDVDNYQLLGEIALGDVTLSTTTNYRSRRSSYDLDADGVNPEELQRARESGAVSPFVPLDPNSAAYTRDTTENFFQDIHLSGTAASDRLKWLIGADMVNLESNYSVTTVGTPGGVRAPATLKYESYAAYGSVGYDFTDALNVTTELRYTTDKRSLSARAYDLATGAPVGGAARIVDAETKPDDLSYNLTLSYDFGRNVLAYGKVGTSYRAGGFNTNLGDPRQPIPIPAAYGDENSTSYEIGVRGAPTRNISFSIAGYYTELKDLIAQTDNGCAVTLPQCPVASTSFLTNAGDARSYGVEAELTLTQRTSFGTFRTTITASGQDGEVTSGRYDGLPLPQVPDFLGSLTINYRYNLSPSTAINANVFYTVQSGGVQELSAQETPLDDYDLLNLRFGLDIGQFSFAVFGKNVLDQRYLIAVAPTIERYSTGRQVGVQVQYNW
jgi:iron complex outermembrane receptor protein